MTSSPAVRPVHVRYEPRGAARELFSCRAGEVVLSGPAGTGKSRASLEKLHLCALKYPGMRALMLRKELSTLTATGLVTFKERVLHPLDGVTFFGGSHQEPPHFRYPNGSRIVVGGLDNPRKVMSTEYDLIYDQEPTDQLEGEWETLTSRLRNGVMPYQQLMGDVNPDSPRHWLKQRADAGRTKMLESRHEDNPELWDPAAGAWTKRGAAYIAVLDALTGVRYLRLRKGIWAAAEGMVFEGWDPAVHLIDWFEIPEDWPRYWSVDFGFTNPFVWQAWAMDPDGRLYRYREIYRTQRLVEDHAEEMARLTADEPSPVAIICDHDAEDRATLERHLGFQTTAATKEVSPGLQSVASRLRKAGDGRPRIFFLRGAQEERDAELEAKKKPACTEEEFEGYVWDTSSNRKRGEEPVKRDDHGMDATRYVVHTLESYQPLEVW